MTVENDHPEMQYLRLIEDIIENGTSKSDRTGIGTKTKFGTSMRFSLKNNIFPLLTTKRVFFKGVLEELLFFIKGQTDNKVLVEKGVNIWTGNSTKEFLEKQGISREEGDLGPVYGFQWRHFGAEYKTCKDDYTGKGIDQLQNVIDSIRSNPSGRRHVVVAWNPSDLKIMALPPCHCLFQFEVSDGYLNCILYQRSGDMGLGVPFNIASYSLLTIMVAHVTGLKPGEFIHFIGETHVYNNHIEPLKKQLERYPKAFPKLYISSDRVIGEIDDFSYEDFVLEGYSPHSKVKMDMAV
jgi:thymidylate synthase